MKSSSIAASVVFATVAYAEMIGNRHPEGDSRCFTRLLDPVNSGACVDVSHSGSINLYVESECYIYEASDCSGQGVPIEGSPRCYSLKEWLFPGGLRCIGSRGDELKL